MFFDCKNTIYLYTYENRLRKSSVGYIQLVSQGRGYCINIHISGADKFINGQYPYMLITKEQKIPCGLLRISRGNLNEKHYLPVHDNAFYINNAKTDCSLVEGIAIQINASVEIAGYFNLFKSELALQFPIVNALGDEKKYFVIKPVDCKILSGNDQELMHNSFLLHGYYNYRHIILGPCQLENKTAMECCVIGVPGTFYQRELAVAQMFGFGQFVCKGSCEPSKFGYYIKEVALPQNMIYK